MLLRIRSGRDPFWDDGQGARRLRTKRRVLGNTAFFVAIVACGLTAAMWIREIAPVAGQLLG
jgi:hypothetical protein